MSLRYERVVGKPVRVQIPPSTPSESLKGIQDGAGFPFFVKTARLANFRLAAIAMWLPFDLGLGRAFMSK